nr:PAS domain S-box protein [uncultured Desulfobacter sp.]
MTWTLREAYLLIRIYRNADSEFSIFQAIHLTLFCPQYSVSRLMMAIPYCGFLLTIKLSDSTVGDVNMTKEERRSNFVFKPFQHDNRIGVELKNAPIVWDLENGNLSFFGIDSALFWTDPSLVRMLSPLAKEIGLDLFQLLIAYSSSFGTYEDYHAMVSTLGKTFKAGFLAWGEAVSTAGWGIFEMPEFNAKTQQATVIIHNSWEIRMQRNLPAEERWGCPFLQGKIIGIFSHAFNTRCWADVFCYYDQDKPYAELKIFPSKKTIEDEIKKIRYLQMAKKEQVLAKKIEDRTAELKQAQKQIEEYSKTLEQKVAQRTSELLNTNKQLQAEINIRRQTENALQQSYDTLNHTLAASPIGIVLVENRILKWANDEFKSLFRFESKKDYQNKSTRQLYVNEEDYLYFGRIFYDEAKAGEPIEGETTVRRKDGSTFPAHIKISSVDPSDPMQRAVLSISDITSRKQAEQTLLNTTKRLQSITDSSQDAIIVVDRQGKILFWNPAAKQIFGYTHQEAMGRNLHHLLMLQHYSKAYNNAAVIFQQIGQGNAINKTIELEAIRKDGEKIAIGLSLSAIDSQDGWSAVGVIRDITEQRKTHEMLIQSEKMLSVGGLAAGMAHEINNPLAGMVQNANVLKSRLRDIDMQANLKVAKELGISTEDITAFMEKRNIFRMIDAIQESGVRAAEIVNSMLSFARKSDATVSSIYPDKLMDEILELAATSYDFKKQYDFKSIKIIKEYADNLPLLPCEGAKIQQVLLNIFRNGAQAMQTAKTKSPRFILRIFSKGEPEMVHIEIEDNGPGMDEQTRLKVFEPFFTTKPVGVGTGLGLSVSYFIITENHKGTMDVISEPGKGANFIIRLPVDKRKDI